MRLTVKKYNLAALAVLTAPAVLIFEASAREIGGGLALRALFYASLALGVVMLNQAMNRLSDDRLDRVAGPLAGAAVALGAVATLLAYAVTRA